MSSRILLYLQKSICTEEKWLHYHCLDVITLANYISFVLNTQQSRLAFITKLGAIGIIIFTILTIHHSFTLTINCIYSTNANSTNSIKCVTKTSLSWQTLFPSVLLIKHQSLAFTNNKFLKYTNKLHKIYWLMAYIAETNRSLKR